MTSSRVLLKGLLQDRHWQTYRIFCAQYDRAAQSIDEKLVGTWPSRAQLHRWLSGTLKGLPYPDHCRILEEMFPGFTVQELLGPAPERHGRSQVFSVIAAGLAAPEAEAEVRNWNITGSPPGAAASVEDAGMPARISAPGEGLDPLTRELGQRLLELQKVRQQADNPGVARIVVRVHHGAAGDRAAVRR